mmetsp:Transcript_83009/g.101746  ORF Transcript_83009/g.101746 Transcript_83009/m.101746 type:complete len:103 (+) Transcript_83009:34-342(+)
MSRFERYCRSMRRCMNINISNTELDEMENELHQRVINGSLAAGIKGQISDEMTGESTFTDNMESTLVAGALYALLHSDRPIEGPRGWYNFMQCYVQNSHIKE